MRISDWSSDVCSSDLITPRTEQVIRRSALEEIFGKLRKSGRGQHTTKFSGQGDERNAERREYRFGDSPEQIDMTTSLHNAQINHGIGDFRLTEQDLEVEEMDYKTITSTRSEEHTSELQSLMRNSYAVFCLKKKKENIETLPSVQHRKTHSGH